MRKASFSVEKVSSNTDAHNTREHSPKYLLGCEEGMENVYIKYYDYDNFRELAEARYVEVNKQKMQSSQKENLFEEAVISLEEHHTKEDLENLFKSLNQKYTGHTLINLAIHRDEGHFEKDGIEYYPTKHILQKDDGNWYILDEDDTEILQALQDKDFKPKSEDFKIKVNIEDFEKVYNYHAHAVFSRFDLETGKSARLQKKDMSERYKFVAENMQMRYAPDESRFVKKSINQYKTDKSNSRNERLILKKQLENEHQKEIIKLKEENKALKAENKDLKIENEALKIDNKDLKFNKKELENQIKDLSKNLRETLKELGALRPQYAELEALNKELKEELKNELLNHDKVIKSYQDLEKKLKEEISKKDEKIDNLEVENKDLKSELEALKYQLDLKEKRSQAYFGLNQELKSEIIALKSQINDLEEQKEVLEEKVIDLDEKVASRANIDDLSSTKQIKKEDYLTQIVNQYDSSRTGTDKSEALNINKTEVKEVDLSRFKANQNKSFLNKLNAIDEKIINDNTDNTKTNTRRGRDR